MCDLVENYAKECAAEAVREATQQITQQVAFDTENNAKRLFENGVSYDIVRISIPSLSDETLQRIYNQVKKDKFE